MNDLKTPVSRLARLFRDARDRWKAKVSLVPKLCLGMRGAKLCFAAFTREAELPRPGSQTTTSGLDTSAAVH
jgi:hypothetical protein